MCPLLDIINKDKILFCDEIESNLHESIVNGLVNLFRGNNISSQSQMIFTTHDTTLLDLDLFRRDHIWFTELTFDSLDNSVYDLFCMILSSYENLSSQYFITLNDSNNLPTSLNVLNVVLFLLQFVDNCIFVWYNY